MLLNLSRATTCSVGRLGLSPNTFACVRIRPSPGNQRSEEHTSELQSRSDLVCRLLLEKKKKKRNIQIRLQEQTRELESQGRRGSRHRMVNDRALELRTGDMTTIIYVYTELSSCGQPSA